MKKLLLIAGSTYHSGRSKHWIKVKNPAAPAILREAEENILAFQSRTDPKGIC